MFSMKDDAILEVFIPTPQLKTKKCRLIAKTIEYLLKGTPSVIAVLGWYLYDYFIAILLWFVFFIIIGIVRSYLRNSSIPMTQQEHPYNDEGISRWYTAKHICLPYEVI